jgi:glycosyltransferase involved in cell wall biosynthesis
MTHELSVIVPAYNESAIIEETIYSVAQTFRAPKNEIIIVCNGCKDDTHAKAQRAAKKFSNVRVLNFPAKIGKGGAVLEGMRVARGKFIGFLDCDLSTLPREFLRMYSAIGKEDDGIIGSRWMPESMQEKQQPFSRRVASRIFNVLIRALFGLPFVDTQCGAKIFSARATQEILSSASTPGWAFDVDILYTLKKKGFRLQELPIEWKDRVDSKLNLQRVSLKMLFAILRLRLVHSPINAFHRQLKPITGLIYYPLKRWLGD